jgi:uroporphyrinogen decarboxylase
LCPIVSSVVQKMVSFQRKYPPDFNQLLRVLRRETPDRPVLFEYFTNDKLNALLAGKPGFVPSTPKETFSLAISAFHNAGFDHATIPSRFFHGLKFEIAHQEKKASVSQNMNAVITDRQSMESYVWPDPGKGDYHLLNDFAFLLPEGMKFIVSAPGGVLENVTDIVGFERLCCMLYEDEELIQEIFDAVGSRLLKFYEFCLPYESVGALIINDDWGFKTQTMLDPDSMRKYVFPWHRKMVAAAHQQGKPVILHSCGNIYSMLDEIIETIGYDAKHSYEDVILPVEQAWQEWSDKIAIVGGIDMDFLATSTPQAVSERAGRLLQLTGSKGYALGSGNSIPEFIPVENFLAMISVI